MQKKLLSLLLIMIATNASAENKDNSGEIAVGLVNGAARLYVAAENYQNSRPTVGNFLKHIRWLYKNNPPFYKLRSFRDDIPYYLVALPDKIKELEYKVLTKTNKLRNGLTSRAMLRGVITTGISMLSAYATYFLWQEGQKLGADRGFVEGAVSMGFVTAIFAVFAAGNFDKAINYTQRLADRLEEYKKILALLEEEYARNGEMTIDGTAIKLMKVVVDAINVAVDQAVNAADKLNVAANEPKVDTIIEAPAVSVQVSVPVEVSAPVEVSTLAEESSLTEASDLIEVSDLMEVSVPAEADVSEAVEVVVL